MKMFIFNLLLMYLLESFWRGSNFSKHIILNIFSVNNGLYHLHLFVLAFIEMKEKDVIYFCLDGLSSNLKIISRVLCKVALGGVG